MPGLDDGHEQLRERKDGTRSGHEEHLVDFVSLLVGTRRMQSADDSQQVVKSDSYALRNSGVIAPSFTITYVS